MSAPLERIERMLGEIERLGDPDARVAARELVRAVLELHRGGLERLLAIVSSAGEPAERAILEGCAQDPLVAGLLLLHELHPIDLETRVRAAVASLAGVELLGVDGGVVRVRVAKPQARAAVEAALIEAAPDAGAIEVEDGALIPAARLMAGAPR